MASFAVSNARSEGSLPQRLLKGDAMTNELFILDQFPKGEREGARTDFMTSEGATFHDPPNCKTCGSGISNLIWAPPYHAEMDQWGERYGDLALSGSPQCILVSERFRDLYENSGMIGLSGFYPVTIDRLVRRNKKCKGKPPTYLKADVARSRVGVDDARSGCVWTKDSTICPECLFPMKGIIKRWTGTILLPGQVPAEDVFVPRGGGAGIMVSTRFKAFCEEHAISNAWFFPAELYAKDFYPWETAGVGSASPEG